SLASPTRSSRAHGRKDGKAAQEIRRRGAHESHKPKLPIAMQLVKDGRKLFDEWLTAAAKLKREAFNNEEKKDGQENKDGAINRAKYFRGLLQDLENNAIQTKDFFVGSRANYDKCHALLKTAMANPADSKALQELYSQEIRNHIGAQFHAAPTQYKGASPEVMK